MRIGQSIFPDFFATKEDNIFIEGLIYSLLRKRQEEKAEEKKNKPSRNQT